MTEAHNIHDCDPNWHPDEARCSCGKWRMKGPRNKRLAAAYRHIADMLDPPESREMSAAS